jgi:Xaa-Pro aminopeptidase
MRAALLLAIPALVAAQSAPSFHGQRLPNAFFAGNRARLIAELKKLGPGTVAVIKSMPEQHRNGDSFHPYRQDSDFYYLTGVEEAEAVAVLDADSDKPYTLYVRMRDPRQETYDGVRLGTEGALAMGADRADSFPTAERTLMASLRKAQRIVLICNFDEDFRKKVLDVAYPLGSDNNKGLMKKTLVDGRHLVAEMRLIKQPVEVEQIQKAVDASIAGHLAGMKASLSATNEGQVAGAFEGTVRALGARFTGYDTIAGSGNDACTLHYPYADKPVQRGDLFLMDAAAEIGFYTADITRTWPVSGTFTPEQRALYDLVYKAQEAAFKVIGPGRKQNEGQTAAMRVISDGLVDLGILKGEKEEVFKQGAYQRFTLHGISHWMGLDVHDTGSYFMEGQGVRTLEPGMVMTVEPGIYIPKGAEGVDAKWHGIGIRIEDDIVLTPEGFRNMSAQLPRKAEDVEKALKRK